MGCDDIRERCYPYLDGELAAPEVATVEAHLVACESCARWFAGERAFLEAVAGAGVEPAPERLRTRIAAMLEESHAESTESASVTPLARRSILERIAAPLAAAAVVGLVILQSGDRLEPGVATDFASDHVRHATIWPDITPFPGDADVPPAPVLAKSEVTGLSRCRIEGRGYAHYVYVVEDDHMSVYLPLDAGSPPPLDTTAIGRVSIVAVEAMAGRPSAVLVSSQMSPAQLTASWTGS